MSMTKTPDITNAADRNTEKAHRKQRIFSVINKTSSWLNAFGLGWMVPIAKIAAGDSLKEQGQELWQSFFIPLLGIAAFVFAWAALAPQVQTSLGTIPGPLQVLEQSVSLWNDHVREREKEVAFFERLEKKNQKLIAAGKTDKVKLRKYTGKPTYIDQIVTSLETVAVGFIFATFLAVPLGIASGLSRTVSGAISPLIQIFKPISPLAWLPIVTMVVSATYVNSSDAFPKSLVVSAVTVTLCSLWQEKSEAPALGSRAETPRPQPAPPKPGK